MSLVKVLVYWGVETVLIGILAVSSDWRGSPGHTRSPRWTPFSPWVINEKPLGFSIGEHPNLCGMPAILFGKRSVERMIIGGHEARPHDWPWHANIRLDGRFQCEGTIIKERWILTAAHCVNKPPNPGTYTVTVGMHDINNPMEKSREEYRVQKLYIRYKFKIDWRGRLDDDIALMYLDKKITYNWEVKPVCIDQGKKDPKVGETCVTIGYRDTRLHETSPSSKIKQLEQQIISNAECSKFWGTPIPDNQICVKQSGSGTCFGDSGGALMCQYGFPWYIYGITSFNTYKYNLNNTAAVFTRVTKYYDWIETQMKSMGQ